MVNHIPEINLSQLTIVSDLPCAVRECRQIQPRQADAWPELLSYARLVGAIAAYLIQIEAHTVRIDEWIVAVITGQMNDCMMIESQAKVEIPLESTSRQSRCRLCPANVYGGLERRGTDARVRSRPSQSGRAYRCAVSVTIPKMPAR